VRTTFCLFFPFFLFFFFHLLALIAILLHFPLVFAVFMLISRLSAVFSFFFPSQRGAVKPIDIRFISQAAIVDARYEKGFFIEPFAFLPTAYISGILAIHYEARSSHSSVQ